MHCTNASAPVQFKPVPKAITIKKLVEIFCSYGRLISTCGTKMQTTAGYRQQKLIISTEIMRTT